jgi:hypothetical protein
MTRCSLIIYAVAIGGFASAQEQTAAQRTFGSPDDAVQALIDATSKDDTAALAAVLGSKGQGLLSSGDAARDQAERKEFAQLASMRHRLEASSMKAGTMILLVGDQDWPFPVPLRQVDQRWRFDAGLGSLEVRARRVGANELDAIEICAGYVEAQQAYAADRRSGASTMEYARNLVSLNKPLSTQPASAPLVPKGFVEAAKDTPGANAKPYHGYYFRVLAAQGSNAPGGEHKYLAGKYMIGGFALAAWPAEYGVTGIHTFVVNQDGIVYEKDLGRQTAVLAPAIARYDPDSSWSPVD